MFLPTSLEGKSNAIYHESLHIIYGSVSLTNHLDRLHIHLVKTKQDAQLVAMCFR
jgi:hypothetical protein